MYNNSRKIAIRTMVVYRVAADQTILICICSWWFEIVLYLDNRCVSNVLIVVNAVHYHSWYISISYKTSGTLLGIIMSDFEFWGWGQKDKKSFLPHTKFELIKRLFLSLILNGLIWQKKENPSGLVMGPNGHVRVVPKWPRVTQDGTKGLLQLSSRDYQCIDLIDQRIYDTAVHWHCLPIYCLKCLGVLIWFSGLSFFILLLLIISLNCTVSFCAIYNFQ